MKVVLEQVANRGYRPPEHCETPLVKSLPFYKSKQGQYVHRPRSGKLYFRHQELSHVALHLWCGMTGFLSKGELLDHVPAGSPVCATCEGRATGAGQLGSHKINGQIVKFSPREKRKAIHVGNI